MSRPHRRRRAVVPLSLTCLALAGVIYGEFDLAPGELDASAATPALPARLARPAGVPVSFAMPPIAAFGETVDRPVFSPTRRPPPAERGRDSAAQLGSLVLVGLVIAPDGRRALIDHGQPPRIQRVTVGQEVEGWRVEAILPDRVVVHNGNARAELKLKDKAPPNAPPTRQPPTPAAPR